MKPWQRAFLFVSGVVCALAIVAIARLADAVSARELIVPEPPVKEKFDWLAVKQARAVLIPPGPPPEIEVHVAPIAADRMVWRPGTTAYGSGELHAYVHGEDAGRSGYGASVSEGNGFSGTNLVLRIGWREADVRLRVEDFRDFGPPFESVWSHVRGTVQLSSWPIEPGKSVIAFDLEGSTDEETRSFSGAFVAP